MTLIDTSALIDYLLNRESATHVAELLSAGEGAASAISVFELLAGVKTESHVRERKELIGLLEIIPISVDIAVRAASLYTSLRSRGITVENEDLIVAATGLALNASILTVNTRHFKDIPGLSLFEQSGS